MSKIQPVSIFEYDKKIFAEPLTAPIAVLLNKKCEELKNHTKSTILEPVRNNQNQTIGIRSFQYVGVIQIHHSLTIQILPKMSASEDNETAWKESVQNLLYMMQYCGKLLSTHSSDSQLKSFKGDFYEILIYLFATTLLSEIRNNLHHEYESKEQNLAYLRGKLLFSKHILINGVTQEKFYVTTDNFEFNNKLNIIFAYVVRMLLNATSHATNKRLLGELDKMLTDIDHQKITIDDANKIHINRLNKRFKPALELAKLFLSGKSLQLSKDSFTTATFLIDMNALFEDYITTVCKKVAPEGTIVQSQGPRQYLVSAHYADDIDKSQQLFMMKPDISIVSASDPSDVKHIIDTKYKILDPLQRKLGVSQPDLYQMYAYSNKYDVSEITLLYPEQPDQQINDKVNVIDKNCTVLVKTIDLNRDLKRSEYLIKQEIKEILQPSKVEIIAKQR